MLLSTITVNSTADDGSVGTLRWAIGQANTSNQADTVVFSSLFDTPQTIPLTGGRLELAGTSGTTTITGPGESLLSISGNNASRVFQVDGNASATISGLTITGGHADNGGGLYIQGNLTLTNCTVSGNSATDDGGGLYNLIGPMTLINSTVVGNSVTKGGGLTNLSMLSLTNCNAVDPSDFARDQGPGCSRRWPRLAGDRPFSH